MAQVQTSPFLCWGRTSFVPQVRRLFPSLFPGSFTVYNRENYVPTPIQASYFQRLHILIAGTVMSIPILNIKISKKVQKLRENFIFLRKSTKSQKIWLLEENRKSDCIILGNKTQ